MKSSSSLLSTLTSVLFVLLVFLLYHALARRADALTYSVTNTGNNGAGSLRQAVLNANINPGPDTIDFALAAGPQTISLTGIQIVISDEVTINGPFPGRVTIDATSNSRVFDITSSGSGAVSLNHLRFINGSKTGGGALRAGGASTQVIGDNLVFENNAATNATGNGGGAIGISEATVVLTDSALVNNTSAAAGGAITLINSAGLELTNTTVSGNSADSSGGGIANNGGSVDLTNVTLSNNTADADTNNIGAGGGVSTITLSPIRPHNTIIAGNICANTGPDISGISFLSEGHNIIGISSGGGGFTDGVNGDQVGSSGTPLDPKLAAVADNGGDTLTHHLQTGSPAINTGDNAALAAPPFDDPGRDQRGQFRPFNTTVDIGAYERPLAAVVTVTDPIATARENGSTNLIATFERAFTGGPLDIDFELDAAGTATLSADFVLISSSIVVLGGNSFRLTIPDGETTVNLIVNIKEDTDAEPDEFLIVNLVNAPGYQVDPGAANGNSVTLTITNDDFTLISGGDSGPGTLRDAIDLAEAADGGSITIPSSVSPVMLTSGDITITEPIEIIGLGNEPHRIDAGGNSRLFFADNTVGCIRFENLVLTGGSADGIGGALYIADDACVEIEGCAITGNESSSSGGAIYHRGTLSLLNSSIDGNEAGGIGGAMYCVAAEVTILNTTIARNRAEFGAGGLHFSYATTGAMEHTTITENTCDTAGTGAGDGGGILFTTTSGSNLVAMTNCIIAGNFDSPGNSGSGTIHPDVSGAFTSLGFNLFGDALGGSGYVAGDQTGAPFGRLDPKLMQCAPVEPVPLYFTLAPDSPAVDAGNGAGPNITALDQRGYDRNFGLATDIGSTELDLYLVTSTANTGPGTLRALVSIANILTHGTIGFDTSGPFATAQTIPIAATGDIILAGDITIIGPSDPSQRVTIDAGGADRIFDASLGDIFLKNLTLTGGDTSGNIAGNLEGGAIRNNVANVTLDKCTIDDNRAGGSGGGIHSSFGVLTVRDCIISNNNALGGSGGGIFDAGGNVANVSSTTFHGNRCDQSGGGFAGGVFNTIDNCTFSANSARVDGGGVSMANPSANLIMNFCTLTLNTADLDNNGTGSGGGIHSVAAGSSTIIRGSLIAENIDLSGTAPDYDGDLNVLIISFLGDNTGSSGTINTSTLSGTGAAPLDPKLVPLADNGGCTPTHALRCNSPAIGATSSYITSGDTLFDQRGINRRDNTTDGNGFADCGAYELTSRTVSFNFDDSYLRDAIARVNETGAGIVRFSSTAFAAKETVILTSELVVTGNLCVIGPDGPGQGVTISGQLSDRVFNIVTDVNEEVVLENLTLTGGRSGSAFGGNLICSGFGDFRMRRCTVTDGVSETAGGGMAFLNTGLVVLENTTVSGNFAYGSGGGLFIAGPDLTLRASTITNNVCDAEMNNIGDGGGLQFSSGTCTLRNTLVAGNNDFSGATFPSDVNAAAPGTSLGYNLIGAAAGASGFTDGVNNDQVGVADPKLGALADNGGPTETHALLEGSPAVDAGSPTTVLASDQRGAGFSRLIHTATDIGAFESLLTYNALAKTSFPPGTPPAQRDPAFDFDGDSLANGIEFLIGSNLVEPDNTGQVTGHVDGTDLVIEFPLSIEVDPALAVVQHSTDLGLTDPWDDSGVSWDNQGALTATTDLIFATIPIGSETELFGKLTYQP